MGIRKINYTVIAPEVEQEIKDKYTKQEMEAMLSDKVSNSRVLTDVPANAKFTDTTYSEISTSEIDAGTSSTLRTISGRRVKYILDKVSTMILAAISNLTKTDVGLGNVDNVKQASKTEFDNHVNNKSNPHSVTKSQVGLGNVQNYGIATQAEAEAGTSNAKYMTPLRVKQAIDKFKPKDTSELTKSDVYTKNEVDAKLDEKVDNSRVLTNVPANAKFTDTITTINGKTGVITKDDIVALGISAQDTTYSEISEAEIDIGTSSTKRVITGRRVKYILDKVQDWINSLTKADIGLGNVDNVKQATKVEFDAHNNDAVRHITDTERMTWNSKQDALGYIPLNSSLKGASGGLAELDASGKVPISQLPSYVDDVLEFSSLSAFPTTGETGKIYVATNTNLTYRWSGTGYVEISPSIALGETSSTAYRGDRGKVAYDHSQSAHARIDATKVENSATNGNIKINGVETNIYTHPTTSGSKHIPAGGSTGQYLKWSADGTAIWDTIAGGLELGETSGTAYRGDRGKIAYDHSQSSHAPVDSISKSNTTLYTPTSDYNPATKKYVDDNSGLIIP